MIPDEVRSSRQFRWLGVAAVAAGILYASVLSSPAPGGVPSGPLGVFGLDKWLHALAYAALAGTLAIALAPGRDAATTALVAVLLGVGYGVGIEFVQAPLPTRHRSVADAVADAVGVGVGVALWWVVIAVGGESRGDGTSESEA